jgi:succinoglycan biosynthesis protein ExoM
MQIQRVPLITLRLGSNMVEKCKVVVCVPTYKRTALLETLLIALEAQDISEKFCVILGNNDTASVEHVFPPFSGSLVEINEIFVSQRGVTAVRNAMISTALKKIPSAEWVACIDDDQVPDIDWLRRIVSAGRSTSADLVGGPVRKIPASQTFWSAGATATGFLPTTFGPVEILNAAGNLLISMKYLRGLERAPFDIAFGKTGGEDYEFFMQAKRSNAKMVWEPDAKVDEIIPVARLTFKGFTWRSYSTSASQARADKMHHSIAFVGRKLVRNSIALPVAVTRSLVRTRSPSLATTELVGRLASLAGTVAGLAGRRLERYGTDGQRV